LSARARAEGLIEIHGDVLAENTTMLKMCGELGFVRLSGGDDPRLISVTLEL
jgi:acetyltransferase